jgi:hypothetical protein
MTNEDFKKKYNAIFSDYFLFTKNGETMVCGTYRVPTPGYGAFAYVPQLDDFLKIPYEDIVCSIRLKSQKSKV